MCDSIPSTIPANLQDCIDYLICRFGDQLIRCVLTFDTHLDPERLRRAARATLDMVPVLGCRYDTSVKRPVWRRMEGLDSLPLVTVVETADRDAAVREALLSPLDREREARVALTLIRGPEGDSLAITVDHVASDARGTKEYAYLLASAYSRLAEEPRWWPEPRAVVRPTDGELARRIPWRDRWRASIGLPKAAPGFVVPGRWEVHSGRETESAHFEADAFRRLREWGRAREASVNDILLAAIARSAFGILDHRPGEPVGFQCTADLRRYLEGGGDGVVCNLSMIWRPSIVPVEGEALEATVAQARAQTAEWRDRYFGLGMGLTGTPLYRLGGLPMFVRLLDSGFEKMRAKSETSPALTNFGVLDDGRLAFAGETPSEAWMTGPVAFGNGLVVVASTYRDRLTLSIGWCDSDIDAELPRRLLAGTMRELSAPAATTAA